MSYRIDQTLQSDVSPISQKSSLMQYVFHDVLRNVQLCVVACAQRLVAKIVCVCVRIPLASQINIPACFRLSNHVVHAASARILGFRAVDAHDTFNVTEHSSRRLLLRHRSIRNFWHKSDRAERCHDLWPLSRVLGCPSGLSRQLHVPRVRVLHQALPEMPAMQKTTAIANRAHQTLTSYIGLRVEGAECQIQMQHDATWMPPTFSLVLRARI